MNIKNITIALIIALAFDMLKKTVQILFGGLYSSALVSGSMTTISFIIGAILLVFLVTFYQEERGHRPLSRIIQFVLGTYLILILFRISWIAQLLPYQYYRLLIETVGLCQSVLFFALVYVFRKQIAPADKFLTDASLIVLVMFALWILKDILALLSSARYALTGVETLFSTAFYSLIFAVFLFRHLAVIYFLYNYYLFKSKSG